SGLFLNSFGLETARYLNDSTLVAAGTLRSFDVASSQSTPFLLRSTNGGATWITSSPVGGNDLHFFNPMKGYATHSFSAGGVQQTTQTYGGSITGTADGGQSWSTYHHFNGLATSPTSGGMT